MSKILVTGGAGFIGSHLVERLVPSGHEVTVVDDFSYGVREYLAGCPQVRILTANVLDLPKLAPELAGVEVIFHLAALISSQDSLREPERYFETNVTGTLRVIETAGAIGARRVVLASSSTVYGNSAEPVKREDMLPQPITVYALSKLASEHLLALYAPLKGYSHVALRLFNVYGPRQSPDHPYANVTCKLAHAASHGQNIDVYGDGQQSRDFVYVDDVVSAFVAVAMHSERSVYNVGSGVSRSINELVDAVQRVSGVPLKRRDLPPWPNDIRMIRADTQHIARDHGFKTAITLEEGLLRSVEYFRQKR
jgi:UDP-glucose 4-epimerase